MHALKIGDVVKAIAPVNLVNFDATFRNIQLFM